MAKSTTYQTLMHADTRVREIAKLSNPPFGALMSPADLLLAREVGYEPIAPVTGTCVISIDKARARMGKSRELPKYTALVRSTWSAALDRLQRQAQILGASGVVGVCVWSGDPPDNPGPQQRIRHEDRIFDRDDLACVSLVGTAIRLGASMDTTMPFVCDLTGQELCMLMRAGYSPAGFALGNCVWFQRSRQKMEDGRNKEVTGLTLAFNRARSLAMQRAIEMASANSGDGIVGLKVEAAVFRGGDTSKLGYDPSVALSFLATGTIIRSQPAAFKPVIDYSVLLNDCSKRCTKQGET